MLSFLSLELVDFLPMLQSLSWSGQHLQSNHNYQTWIQDYLIFRSGQPQAFGGGIVGGLLGSSSAKQETETAADLTAAVWSKTANTMFPLTATWGVKSFER